MTRFQIRTPQNLVLESVTKEMSEEAWNSTLDLINPELVLRLNASHYLTQLRHSMGAYVKKYDLCNNFPECSDEVEGGPWLDRTDRIYLLDAPDGLNSFFDDLAFEILESSKHIFNAGTSREAFTRLRKSFRHSLNRYLYFNPICRDSAICADSKEVTPWASEEARVAS